MDWNTRLRDDAFTLSLIRGENPQAEQELMAEAGRIRSIHFGRKVYLRGLIEFTNYCKNDCLYCGIRAGNRNITRYRLSTEQILACCAQGAQLGFHTFVLQGGEDPYYTDERLTALVGEIRHRHPDCAITLSVGERSAQSYHMLKQAGADRYLLRHETATESHYAQLHPKSLKLSDRIRCLHELRDAGFQTGAGFMVGSPHQTPELLLADLRFLQELRPHMIGIGPFLPHHETPFAAESPGSAQVTLRMLALCRVLLPEVLLPATTALGSLVPGGRTLAFAAGANVVMPNLSPRKVRASYSLYDNKLSSGNEAAENRDALVREIEAAGFEADFSRGDHPAMRTA